MRKRKKTRKRRRKSSRKRKKSTRRRGWRVKMLNLNHFSVVAPARAIRH